MPVPSNRLWIEKPERIVLDFTIQDHLLSWLLNHAAGIGNASMIIGRCVGRLFDGDAKLYLTT